MPLDAMCCFIKCIHIRTPMYLISLSSECLSLMIRKGMLCMFYVVSKGVWGKRSFMRFFDFVTIEFSVTCYFMSAILWIIFRTLNSELCNSLMNKHLCFLAYCLQSFALQGSFKQVLITQIWLMSHSLRREICIQMQK